MALLHFFFFPDDQNFPSYEFRSSEHRCTTSRRSYWCETTTKATGKNRQKSPRVTSLH
uniref:Uncharacterized protein n=1 Tax=Anguilla anguilla TaxID=7936 RepID=A0A0E9W6P0_ANGAN